MTGCVILFIFIKIQILCIHRAMSSSIQNTVKYVTDIVSKEFLHLKIYKQNCSEFNKVLEKTVLLKMILVSV